MSSYDKNKIKVEVTNLIGWKTVLSSARTTVGKKDLNKEPSDEFKRSILISEHSPIRSLVYEVVWTNIPYFVAMHLRTHHIGFKSNDDDIYYIKTSRSDRANLDRDVLPQTAPVKCRAILNAQSIINCSRVRLCKLASQETQDAWNAFILELSKTEPFFNQVCVPNCIYRCGCPEGANSCGMVKTEAYQKRLSSYHSLFC